MDQQQEQEQLEEQAADLVSGKNFYRHAASARSRYGYEPPLSRRQWAECMAALANMAAQSDALAQVASGIRVNLYGTASQAQAAVWEGAAKAVAAGYDDVIGRSGPEGGRYKVRPYTLHQAISMAYYLEEAAAPFASHVPGVGWVTAALARREGVRVWGLMRVPMPSFEAAVEKAEAVVPRPRMAGGGL